MEIMKALLPTAVAALLGVTLLPVLLTNGDQPPLTPCTAGSPETIAILATIRSIESGDNYQAQSRGASASGAYQIIDSTWNNYGGYQHAKDAPTDIQDAKATDMVNAILTRHQQDISVVPVVWYIGHLPAAGSTEWDTIPRPDAGNRLTPRQYQTKWMATYQTRTPTDPGDATDEAVTPAPPEPGYCIGGTITPITDGWSLPGPASLIEANPAALDQPHHDYPAWDWIIPTNTPVYAIRAGTITTTHTWPHNWWTRNCAKAPRPDCDTCGVGITIEDDTGTRWTYCHGTNLTAVLGQQVIAGQQIMWTGNTGRSGTPHLHIEINANGTRRCPQPLLKSLTQDRVGVDPRSLPERGCYFVT